VLSELKTRARDVEDFKTFQENFGVTLKEGLYDDTGHGAEIAALLRFPSTKEDLTTFDDYIARMAEGQDVIYYLAGSEGATARNSKASPLKATKCCCSPTRSTLSGLAGSPATKTKN
jgi:HSP90 family molecular chaperone